MHELYLKMQRNAVVFHTWYSETASKIKRLTTPQPRSFRNDSVPSQATHSFIETDLLNFFVDEVNHLSQRMKDVVDNAPVFSEATATDPNRHVDDNVHMELISGVLRDLSCLASSDNVDQEGVTRLEDPSPLIIGTNDIYTTLEINEIMHNNMAGAGAVGEVEEAAVHEREGDRNVLLLGDSQIIGSADVLSTAEVDHIIQENRATRSIYVPQADGVHHPFLFHSSTALACMSVVPENLGCSIDCGAPDPEAVIVSEVLRRNQNLFKSVFSLRKDIMDYVFNKSDNYSKS